MAERDSDNLLMKRAGLAGFTLVEVLVALAIVSIAMTALLKLNLVSIRTADAASLLSRASVLANQRIEESLAFGYPDKKVESGQVEEKGLTLNWKRMVTDCSVAVGGADVTGLREILVDVHWRQGKSAGAVRMSTYVADRKAE